ncbi:MAG: AAA family ATPase [Deltaproteobacteria bacterium]|nr:AAA family ATPase [Deltaproteobacteria bacterium]
MNAKKLYIAMVGLPAMGKSTIANRLRGNLRKDGIRSRIFNNGDLRRKLATRDTSYPEFYDPENAEGVSLREKIAKANIERARRYLGKGGQVAILDATNVSLKRRETIAGLLRDHPILFVECFHQDDDILEASIERKIALPEFRHLGREAARESFKKRIKYYENIYAPLKKGRNFIRLDSLYNRIRQEELTDSLPYYEQVRDFIVTDTVRNLFLIRHGETYFNLENRIGGDSKPYRRRFETDRQRGFPGQGARRALSEKAYSRHLYQPENANRTNGRTHSRNTTGCRHHPPCGI